MQSANQARHKNRIQSHNLVWLTAFILAVLVVASGSVVGNYLYSYAHQGDVNISLFDGAAQENNTENVRTGSNRSNRSSSPAVQSQHKSYSGKSAKEAGKKSAFTVRDGKQLWSTKTKVDIFRAEYKNAKGETTVRTEDGSKVIAPGTEGSYTFQLRNSSAYKAEYKVWIEAKLSDQAMNQPIQSRMSGKGKWLLGGNKSWKQALDLNGVAQSGTLAAGKTADYTLYWQWPYEQGIDETDTNLGGQAVDRDLTYTITIHTLATSDEGDKGGSGKHGGNGLLHAIQTGDTSHILLWSMILFGSLGFLVGLLLGRKRRKDRENAE